MEQNETVKKHTDEALGDCSFSNTCSYTDTCKYVHCEVDRCSKNDEPSQSMPNVPDFIAENSTTLYPPQWVQCDLRFLYMIVLGEFVVIMADPPWDMELPYGTMSDDEMRQLGILQLQDEGLIFSGSLEGLWNYDSNASNCGDMKESTKSFGWSQTSCRG
ncbi:hypothetical protein WA026_016340 [Henosepilachna vigintioctopunctata]|uniref:mRNA m(6)A methyltransferase n=1 Tax=Henosepilachna vigintioctopunctata TaxID=420089 RepID=A0AAW1UL30_9CUCU